MQFDYLIIHKIRLVLGLVLTKKSKNDPINDEYVTVTYSTVLVRNQSGYYIGSHKSTQIQKMILLDQSRIEINYSDFPKLQFLKYDDPNFYSFDLDPLLNISSLVISRSFLQVFSYNNQNLKNITFYRNQHLWIVWNCNLPSLINIFLNNTENIIGWQNNTLTNLKSIYLNNCSSPYCYSFSSSILKIQNLFISNIQSLGIKLQSGADYKKIHIDSCSFDKIQIFNPHVEVVEIKNSNILDCHFKDAANLKSVVVNLNNKANYGLNIEQSPKFSNLDIEFEYLKQLTLNNTNITSLKQISIANLTLLQLIETPLNQLPLLLVTSPMIDTLQIDYSSFKQHILPQQLPKVEFLYLRNYNGSISAKLNYPHLFYLHLNSCSIETHELNKIPLVNFILQNSYVKMNSLLDILSTSIGELSIYGNSNIQTIDNLNLSFNGSPSGVLSFNNCPNIKSIKNTTFSGLAIITFVNCSELETIQSNTFDSVKQITIKKNPKLILNQTYNSTFSVDAYFDNFSDLNLKHMIQLNPQINRLFLSGYSQKNFSEQLTLFLTYLKTIKIQCDFNCSFTNNHLNTQQLIFQGFNEFKGNQLIQLKYLDIHYRTNTIKMSDIITELQHLKQTNTNLSKIHLPLQATQQDKQTIKEIFPGIEIISEY